MVNETTIALKRSDTLGNTPNALDLAYGELAINYADGNLFYRTDVDTLATFNLIVRGVNKDVLFNDGGVYGTSSGLTFDKATANLAVSNVVTTETINYNNISKTSVGVYSTSNTNQVIVDTFSTSDYRTARYTMQISYDSSSYHSEEITVLHDGDTPSIVEYGVIFSNGSSLGSFDVNIIGSNVNLLFTPVNANTTLKFTQTLISV